MSTTETVPYTALPFDEATVSAAIAGREPYLHPADRQEAVRRLDLRGLNSQEIAAHLRCSKRTVDRAKARAGRRALAQAST